MHSVISLEIFLKYFKGNIFYFIFPLTLRFVVVSFLWPYSTFLLWFISGSSGPSKADSKSEQVWHAAVSICSLLAFPYNFYLLCCFSWLTFSEAPPQTSSWFSCSEVFKWQNCVFSRHMLPFYSQVTMLPSIFIKMLYISNIAEKKFDFAMWCLEIASLPL